LFAIQLLARRVAQFVSRKRTKFDWLSRDMTFVKGRNIISALVDDPRTPQQWRAGPWRGSHCGPVGCLGHLEIVNESDVLDDAVACVVPDVDAKAK